jgi:hypothetical protein
MPSIQQIAGVYIGAAKKNPKNAPGIFRKAAADFVGMAMDPANARNRDRLHRVAMDFAQTASNFRPPTSNDFLTLLKETAQAFEEVGTSEGDDPMDTIARSREVHDEKDPHGPSISIAPETFNKDATLGRLATILSFVNYPTAASSPEAQSAARAVAEKNGIAQAQTVAFWQGKKREAQAITVDVALALLPNFLQQSGEVFSLQNNRPYGLVEFGADGNRTTVKFDLANGKRLTVVGNYVSVSVGMDPPRAGDSSTPLTYGASMGAFAAPSMAPLILTSYIDDLSNVHTVTPTGFANEIIVPIPLKAAFLLPLETDCVINETAQLDFLDVGGDIMFTRFYKQSDTSWMKTVSLVGDVSFVKITNATGNAGVRNFRLPFQLSL